jgi:hypothetical protein
VVPGGALALLGLRGGLETGYATGAILALAQGVGLGLLVLGALRRPGFVRTLLNSVRRIANGTARVWQWLVGRRCASPNNPLPPAWAARLGDDFEQAAEAVRRRPTPFVGVLALASGAHGANLATLLALFGAYGHPAGAELLVIGYAAGVVTAIVAPTPQGMGFVEGALALTFVSLGVPAPVATQVTLAYRGLTFWLPFLVGIALLRRVNIFR